jgi:carboxyl-terminal processing protease
MRQSDGETMGFDVATTHVLRVTAAAAAALVLAACGGGGGGGAPAGSTSCDIAAQKDWLRNYMGDWYLWAGSSPNPAPAGYASVPDYFTALQYAGSSAVPADRWSYLQSSASYNQFFAEGRTMGYGLFVNGIELQLPLKVRMVEPQSPAAAAGLVRGDTILSVNGRTAAELIAANDFAVLSPAAEGEQLNIVTRDAGGTTNVRTLTAATYDLTPVPVTQVLTLSNGAKAGYLVMKDFITQAEAPLAVAFGNFRAEGATELIVDLRYNGGGRISTANFLASQIVGAVHNGKLFTELRYNGAHQNSNSRFNFSTTPGNFSRVVVITGSRTCSASELIVNGLRPHVPVTTVGGATCGKPFGFNPVESCATTFSAVNFQSYNAANQGDYYNGIAATCAMSDDFSGSFGDPAEKLTAAASSFLVNGACPPVAASERKQIEAVGRRARALGVEPGERQGMIAD